MRPAGGRRLLQAVSLLAFAGGALAAAPAPVPVVAFNDGVNHWRSGHGAAYPRLDPTDHRQIADNILLLQRASGGWPVNQDPLRVLDAPARQALQHARTLPGGSFDNRSTYTQMDYLAHAWARTGDARYRDAALRGLDFILDQQIAGCGGWPHSVPAKSDYQSRITFADDVTSGVLGTLREVRRAPRYRFVDAARRQRVATAIARGDDCLLRLQVRQGGTLAIWAGQYDPQTRQPAPGRRFELAALVTDESVHVVRYLMAIEQPSAEVRAAIEGALAWFATHALQGVRLETFDAPAEQYGFHRSTIDRRLVADPAAPPLWGRFHDLADNSVVLADRQGNRLANYTQVTRERRSGYHWYGTWPQALLARDAPAWRARMNTPAPTPR